MKRTLLSGRKKTTQLNPLNPKTKTPTLFDHTTKIKLQKLKQQINEKKKTQHQYQHQHPQPNLPSNKNINKSQTKPSNTEVKVITVQVDRELSMFLKGIAMENYEKVLAENGIDCLEVLREIKQKELEEIGIVKGHALKIIVSLRKMLQSRDKASRKQLSSAETAQNTSKINSKSTKTPIPIPIKPLKQNPTTKNQSPQTNEPLEIMIQTEQGFSTQTQQQLPKRRYFCLYCYQVSAVQFCSEDCQVLYNKMFEKYERNLQKTQELFSKKIQTMPLADEQQNDQNQFVTDLAFLDLQSEPQYPFHNPMPNTLDQTTYKQALDLIKLTINETKQEQTWQTLQENDQARKQLDGMIANQQ